MPFIDLQPRPLDAPVDRPADGYVTPGLDQVTDTPTLGQTFGATMRTENIIGSAVASKMLWTPPEDDPDLKPFDEIKGTKYEPYWNSFVDVRNRGQLQAVMQDIDREAEDRRTVAAAPLWMTVPASLIANVTDPTILIPGGAFVRGAKGGFSVARSALMTGAAMAGGTAAQEVGLHATQDLRTYEESAWQIGASAVLGGAIGAGGAALLSKGETRAAIDALDRDAAKPAEAVTTEPSTSSVGAAAVEPASLVDSAIDGVVAGGAAKATRWMTPGLRLSQSENPITRDVGANLFEMSTYMRGNAEGKASPIAAETLRKEWNAGLMKATEATGDSYSAYRKGGGAMSRSDFEDEIGRAMRRNDEHDVPEVAAAAKAWRTAVINPLRDAAIEAKLLPEDVSVDTAASYFSRMWNAKQLTAEEAQFKQVVTDYYKNVIGNQYEAASRNFAARATRLDQEISDLQLSGPDRAKLMETLPAELDTLKKSNPALEDTSRSVGEFYSQATKARESGDLATAAQHLARAKSIADGAGEDYASYVTKRNLLQSRIHRIRNNVEGRRDLIEQLRGRIADGEVANVERLRRMHRSLTLLDQQIDQSSPETWAADLAKLRSDFADVLDRSTKAQDRLAASLAKIKDEAKVEDTGTAPQSAVPTDFYSLLDAARQRAGADPERKLPRWPVIDFLKKMGGIDPQSPIAAELRSAGATPKAAPGLYKTGGKKALDTIIADEHDLFRNLGDRDHYNYLSEQQIVDFVRDEMGGNPLRSEADRAAIDAYHAKSENIDHYREELESLGVDLGKMSNADVMRRLSEVQGERRFLSDMEAVPPPKGEGDYGAVAPEIVTARQAELKARAETRTRLFDAAEAKRVQEMSKLADRIGGIEAIDPEEAVRLLREAVEARLGQAAGLVEREGQRIAWRLNAIEKADPKLIEKRIDTLTKLRGEAERRFLDRWEVKSLGEGVEPGSAARPDFTEAAKGIADHAFDTLTGRAAEGTRPEFITIKTRGPMKDRTFNIPDEKVERWLESNVNLVGRRYQRIMSSDVELARKFGSPDMADQLQQVRAGYDKLRAGVTNERELLRLREAERSDIRDLEAVRDIIRGNYGQNAMGADYGHVFRIANSVQYLLKMGQVVLSSLTEPVRVVAAKGLLPFMRDGFNGLANISALKASVKEAQFAGNINDRILAHRLSTLADLTDFYTAQGPVEKFLANATNVASSWNGIRLWTDAGKSLASTMIQNQILRGVANFSKVAAKEKRYLAFVGIDESMAGRIADQFAQHGETVGGVHVAKTEAWTDEVAKRTYRAALNKDLDSMIVTRGAADTPLFANTPIGRLILQFNTFNLASHQRVMLRGLQEGHARFIGTVVALSSMGMLQAYLSALAGNRLNTLPSMAENPGWWIAEGLDRSGMFSVPMQLANAVEKITGMNPIKAPMKMGDVGRAQSQKIGNRNELGILGPSAGTLQDIGTVASIPNRVVSGDGVSQAQKNAGERLLPFNSYIGVRQLMRYIVNPPQ